MNGTAKFWLMIIAPLVSAVVAVLVAAGWFMMGGWPGGHADYATVPVPGEQPVTLPEGEVRLYWQAEAVGSGDSISVAGRPDELEVSVTAADGSSVPTQSVPSWLFSSTSGQTGHEPYLKATVPTAGEYLVGTVMTGGSPPPRLAAVTIGRAPWNPGGSLMLGTILVGLLILMIGIVPYLVIRRFLPDDKRGSAGSSGTTTGGTVGTDPATGLPADVASAGEVTIPEPAEFPDPDSGRKSAPGDDRYGW